MNWIEEMLIGKIDMAKFLSVLKSDTSLQNELRTLVPEEARDNPACDLWKKYSYPTLEKYEFDLYELLISMSRLDGSISDNLNVFSRISKIYSFVHPGVVCTKRYEELFDLYLDATRDSMDGPEVKHIVERVILNAMRLSTKSNRRKQAKSEIDQQFHIVDKKKPRWIQGPEWPMGVRTPMMFNSQKRCGEAVEYCFIDVDTGETRTVIQYY